MKRMNEKFKQYTVAEFNKAYKTELTENMEVEELTDYLEENELNYLYCSFDEEDVLSECRDYFDGTGREFNLVCITGLYLALY